MKLNNREWKKRLTAKQYQICREQGTEPPFSGEYWDCKQKGIYHCIACDQPLFSSKAKYDSGTGWPSFFAPYAEECLIEKLDKSLGLQRIELLCSACDSHIGHLFPDGPEPTGLRYCINSTALRFEHKEESV